MWRIQKRATRIKLGIKTGGMRAGYFQQENNEEGKS